MKILIAEDDLVSRTVLSGHLENWGYEVTQTCDGAAAWEAFVKGDYPMAILDWMMPEIDGVELTRRIREARRARYTYLILLTARSQKEDLVSGIEAGADDYVTKPFDREELRVRVLAGQRILELQSALLRAEKSVSVGQVAVGLAHELFEPTSRVRDNLVMLRRDALTMAAELDLLRQSQADAAAEGGSSEEALAPMFNQSIELKVRVQDVIRNLRDFARAENFIMKPIDVRAALIDVADMVRRLAEAKAVTLRLDLGDVPAVKGNAGKLKKVVLHLLVNAIDAVEQRGEIDLRARRMGEEVVITVQDNGRGISAGDLRRVFEPFHSLRHPADRGLGLGLAISDTIIREHGGTLDVESAPNCGATFTIRLPALPAEVTLGSGLGAESTEAAAQK